MRGARLSTGATMLLSLLLVALTWRSVSAQTRPPFDLTTLGERASLRPYVTAYLDPTGRLTLDELRAAPPPVAPLPRDADTTFNYTRTALWLAFHVQNAADHAQPYAVLLDFVREARGPLPHQMAT